MKEIEKIWNLGSHWSFLALSRWRSQRFRTWRYAWSEGCNWPISSERGTRFVNGALGHVKREGKSISLAMSVSFWWLSDPKPWCYWHQLNLIRSEESLFKLLRERERERERESLCQLENRNQETENIKMMFSILLLVWSCISKNCFFAFIVICEYTNQTCPLLFFKTRQHHEV